MKPELVAIIVVAVAVVFSIISSVITSLYRKNVSEKKIGNAESKAREIIDEAIKTAESKKKEALLEAKEENLKTLLFS